MANKDFITNEKDFEIPEGWSEVTRPPIDGGPGAPVPSVAVDRFASGAISTMTLGLNTDIAASQMGGSVPSFRIQPPQPSAISAVNAAVQSVIQPTPPAAPSITPPVIVPPVNTNFIPLPNNGVFFLARATISQTVLQTLGDTSTAQTSAGFGVAAQAAVAPTATNGVAQGVTVGNGSGGGYFGQTPASGFPFWAGRNCRFQARITADSLFNTMVGGARAVMYLGFSKGDPSTLRTLIPSGAASGTTVAFLSAAAGPFPGNWTAFINGVTADTGVAIVANANYFMELIMNDAANTTSFSVNGSVPVIISGSNPSGFAFWPIITFNTADSATHSMTIEYMYAQQDF
jgi:hypothetical protein